MLLPVVGVVVAGLVYKLFIKDPEIHWRIKVLHALFCLSTVLCGMRGSATNFNRARFERMTRLTKNSAPVSAKSETRVQCEDVAISDNVSVRVFRANNAKSNESSKEKTTCLLYIHGGGFTLLHNYSRGYHDLCCDFALGGPIIVVSVEYRLAPEHPFPTAIVDAHAALQWCAHSTSDLLAPCGAPGSRRLCVAGDSAGGNLAAVVSLLSRDGLGPDLKPAPPVTLAHSLLVYPTMHLLDTASRQQLVNAYIIPKSIIDFFTECYLGTREAEFLHDFRLCPPAAKSHRGLAPTTIIVATQDPLRDEGHIYGKLLQDNGVKCEVLEYPSVHGFYASPFLPEAQKAVADSLRRIL